MVNIINHKILFTYFTKICETSNLDHTSVKTRHVNRIDAKSAESIYILLNHSKVSSQEECLQYTLFGINILDF